eukprot:scaffold1403_cov22-Tisochrysis_lutea.AAC.3
MCDAWPPRQRQTLMYCTAPHNHPPFQACSVATGLSYLLQLYHEEAMAPIWGHPVVEEARVVELAHAIGHASVHHRTLLLLIILQ